MFYSKACTATSPRKAWNKEDQCLWCSASREASVGFVLLWQALSMCAMRMFFRIFDALRKAGFQPVHALIDAVPCAFPDRRCVYCWSELPRWQRSTIRLALTMAVLRLVSIRAR